MNKLLDSKFYVLEKVEPRLSANNKVYLIAHYRNQQNGKLFKVLYFEAKKKEAK